MLSLVMEDGSERPIAYASKTFSSSKKEIILRGLSNDIFCKEM